jgi:uncharacterized protein (DUF1330 family)
MPAYAVARLFDVAMGPEIVAYLRTIDATLAPFEGRFIIHGGRVEPLEGAWSGDLIVIAFPTMAHAQNWYDSPAYEEIKPLRARHAKGDVFLIAGVDADHRATDILAGLA